MSEYSNHNDESTVSREKQRHVSKALLDKMQAANLSERGGLQNQEWHALRREGKAAAVIGCVDARLATPQSLGGHAGFDPNFAIMAIPMFAGSMPDYDQRSTAALFRSPHVRTIVAASHFDGDTVGPDATPTGCGALSAKSKLDNGGDVGIPAARYIKDNCGDSDPFLNAFDSARRISELATTRPVLAAAIDHLNQRARAVAVFVGGRSIIQSDMVTLDPAKRYSNGLAKVPEIDPQILEEQFPDFAQMIINSRTIAAYNDAYTDMAKRAKHHDPKVLLATTNSIPFATRFPGAFKVGEVMRLGMIRPPKDRLDGTTPTDDMVRNLLEHASYAMANASGGGHGFESTDTFMVETHSDGLSRNLWEAIKNEQVVQNWLKSKPRTVAIAQTVAGKTESIQIIS